MLATTMDLEPGKGAHLELSAAVMRPLSRAWPAARYPRVFPLEDRLSRTLDARLDSTTPCPARLGPPLAILLVWPLHGRRRGVVHRLAGVCPGARSCPAPTRGRPAWRCAHHRDGELG